MEEEMRTTILNIIVVVLTVVMWLPLATFGGVAYADSPSGREVSQPAKILQGRAAPSVDIICGLSQRKGYLNMVRVNTSVPILASWSLAWVSVGEKPIGRSVAYPYTLVVPSRTDLLRESEVQDYLQHIDLQIKARYHLTVRCGIPGITTKVSFLNGQPWLTVSSKQVLYTEKDKPIRFKRFNLSEQSELTLYMPGRTEGFYANFEWIRTIQ